MVIKNVSGSQFSLEGVVIEPGQSKNLPDEQAKRFLQIYAHTGRLKEEEVGGVAAQATPPITPGAAVSPEATVASAPESTVEKAIEEVEKVAEEIVQPALKVFKRKKKTEIPQ